MPIIKWKKGIDFGACTHIGRRPKNEDLFRIPAPMSRAEPKGLLFAVADGMGGHSGGALASRLACEGLETFYMHRPDTRFQSDIRRLSGHLESAVFRIDRKIRLAGFREKSLAEMGTTLSCLVLKGKRSIIAHVGDSRIYRLRRGHLTCLTTDHTFVQDMIFEGELDPNNAHRHPFRHMLTRVIGTQEPLTLVDIRIDRIKPGDRYLLSTDGLHDVIGSEQLEAVLSVGSDAARTAKKLVDIGLRSNARDNLTAVVIFIPG